MKRVFPAGRPCPVQSVSFTLPAGTTACGYPVNDVGAYPGVDGSRAVHRRQPECRCTGHRRVGCPGYIAGARYRCEWKRRPSVWPYTLHLCCKRWRHHTRKKVHPITRCVTGQPIDACHGVICTGAPCMQGGEILHRPGACHGLIRPRENSARQSPLGVQDRKAGPQKPQGLQQTAMPVARISSLFLLHSHNISFRALRHDAPRPTPVSPHLPAIGACRRFVCQ